MGALKDGLGGGTGLAGVETELQNDLLVSDANIIYFRDTGLNIYSSTDGRLDIVADQQLRFTIGTGASVSGNDYYFRVDGQTKLYNRPLTHDTFALDVKADYKAATGGYSGAFACTMRIYPTGDTTTCLGRAGYFSAQLKSGDTITASGGLVGLACIANNGGTLNGSGIMVAGVHAYIDAGGTFTSVSHVCSAWLDSHQEGTVNGSHQLLYMTNNGASTMDQAIYVYGGNKISYLMELNTVSGMASVTNGAVLADIKNTANAGYIKMSVDGTDKYIALYDIKTS